MRLLIFFLGFIIVSLRAYQQELQLSSYFEKDFVAIVLKNPHEDLKSDLSYRNVLVKTTHYCVRGWWRFYENAEYAFEIDENGNAVSYGLSIKTDNSTQRCQTINPKTIEAFSGSVRHLGPPDTATVAVTFYEKIWEEGIETLVEAVNGVLPEAIGSILFTGRATWTFWEQVNYNGKSVNVTITTDFLRCSTKTTWPESLKNFSFRSVAKLGSSRT